MWGYSNTNGVLRIKCGTQNSRGYSIQTGYSNVNEGTQFILISMGTQCSMLVKNANGVLRTNVVLRSQWGTQNSIRIFKCQIELEWWICTYSRLRTGRMSMYGYKKLNSMDNFLYNLI